MNNMHRFFKTRFNIFLSIILLAGITFSIIKIATAVAPNPGHDFTSISGGVAQGDLLYGSATDTLSALAKNVTATRYLSNTGTSNNPAWAQVNLTNGVTGILPTANGGTGMAFFTVAGPTVARTFTFPDASATVLTSNTAVTVAQGGTGLGTLTANNVILGNGTSNVTFVAPGTSGNVLTSNGTTWTSAAPSGGGGSFPTAKLAANVTTTSATAYSTAFSYTPPASAQVRLDFYLISSSSTAGNAVQYRVSSADTGNVGNCMFTIPTAATAATFDVIAIASAPADDGGTLWLNTARTAVKIECTFTSDASPGAVLLEFQGEIASTTYTVHAGSYYVAVTQP